MTPERREELWTAIGEANNSLVVLPDDTEMEADELRALLESDEALERVKDLPERWRTDEDLALATYAGQAVIQCANELECAIQGEPSREDG